MTVRSTPPAVEGRICVRLTGTDRHNLTAIAKRLESHPGAGAVTISVALRAALGLAADALSLTQIAVKA